MWNFFQPFSIYIEATSKLDVMTCRKINCKQICQAIIVIWRKIEYLQSFLEQHVHICIEQKKIQTPLLF